MTTTSDPPAELVFADWYRREFPQVARALALSCGDPLLGEEAAAEAFARALATWDFVDAGVTVPPERTVSRAWQVNYGDETFVESDVRGKFTSLNATSSPRESVAVTASMYPGHDIHRGRRRTRDFRLRRADRRRVRPVDLAGGRCDVPLGV